MKILLVRNDNFGDLICTTPAIEALRKKYPDAKIRVLEDPAWPPTRASFMLKIEWKRDVNYQELENLSLWLKDKLKPIFEKLYISKADIIEAFEWEETKICK